MIIKVEQISGTQVVSVNGGILQEDVAEFKASITQLLEQKKNRIILDLQGAHYISSMCLGVILSGKKKAKGGKGDIKLARINSLIYRLLETTKLLGEIEVFSSVEEALKSFENN